jgi:extracellular elastinolytic metalloproteinase
MIPKVDTREAASMGGTPEPQDEIIAGAREVSNRPDMPTCEVTRLNPATATAAELRCSGGPPSEIERLKVDAQRYVQATSSALGSRPDDVFEFATDPIMQMTSTGATIVQLHQLYRGVPVFQKTRTMIFDANGRLTKVKGDHAPLPETLDTVPKVNAVRAVQAAGDLVSEPGEGGEPGGPPLPDAWAPRVVAAFALPSQPTVLDAEPFVGLTPAHLVVFYQGPTARLGWQVQLTLPPTDTSFRDQCVVVVGADRKEPEILFSRGTAHTIVEGDVFERDPDQTPQARIAFPVPAATYRPLPATSPEFPKEWCYGDETDGRNVRAITEKTWEPIRGTHEGSTVVFSGGDTDSYAQHLVNAFYFCNYLHDSLELLGFDEEAGNFEAGSTTATGAPGDPVSVVTSARALLGVGYHTPSADGTSPILGLGFYRDTGKHTALDFTLVAHEYTHGVTSRLVGGPGDPVALAAPQSEGLGEGISDFFALSILNFRRRADQPELQVVGDWLTGTAGGLRCHPYDASYPGTYGMLGTVEYSKPHDIGELWCATMMELIRRWCDEFGRERAYPLGWRVVLDSLKRLSSAPSFLDARDAMEEELEGIRDKGELEETDHAAARRLLWEVFARFGMGFGATTDGASLQGIVESTQVPPGLG